MKECIVCCKEVHTILKAWKKINVAWRTVFYEFGEDTKILTWIQLKDQKQFLQVLSKGDRDMGGGSNN